MCPFPLSSNHFLLIMKMASFSQIVQTKRIEWFPIPSSRHFSKKTQSLMSFDEYVRARIKKVHYNVDAFMETEKGINLDFTTFYSIFKSFCWDFQQWYNHPTLTPGTVMVNFVTQLKRYYAETLLHYHQICMLSDVVKEIPLLPNLTWVQHASLKEEIKRDLKTYFCLLGLKDHVSCYLSPVFK